jgi:hypothetical protein
MYPREDEAKMKRVRFLQSEPDDGAEMGGLADDPVRPRRLAGQRRALGADADAAILNGLTWASAGAVSTRVATVVSRTNVSRRV